MQNADWEQAERILKSRAWLRHGLTPPDAANAEEEGGCGVTGLCANIPVAGRHIFSPSLQMHNRGNGKGGGIAAVGFDPDTVGISRGVVETHYCFQVAVIDPNCISEIEKDYIRPYFQINAWHKIETIDDWRDLPNLPVKPPDVYRYYLRAQAPALDKFIKENNLQSMDVERAEDEFVFQRATAINREFYASLGEKKAFMLSYGRNMCILKIVGFAEDVVKYYQLENFKAHVWIAHQRYPTRGRVWHPGGAHPFPGMHEALVHNGDFANYHSVSEYLWQHNTAPMFLTDTEAAAIQFDLLNRVYQYPMEYIIEAMAPTTELDFDMLPEEKQRIYRHIQTHHVHSAPDGPWFFIIARYRPRTNRCQLIGITDTAMLRPQVFAMHKGDVEVGLVCSEKQAIDATLLSLASEDNRFCPIADAYWNARGGSHSNGGAFIFSVQADPANPVGKTVICTDKFGKQVEPPAWQRHCDITIPPGKPEKIDITSARINKSLKSKKSEEIISEFLLKIRNWEFDPLRRFCNDVAMAARNDSACMEPAIRTLTHLIDRRYDTGSKKRASVLHILHIALYDIFKTAPTIESMDKCAYKQIGFQNRNNLRAPRRGESVLVIDAAGFEPELENRDSKIIVDAFHLGWKNFITFNLVGQRFHGVGLGPDTDGVRIDIYGSSGDYLGSGMDGIEIRVHGNGQDQLGQILKSGKMVIYGDVGQTFMYGAKGGEVYVMGSAAGRPLINGVGRPRVIINGTCLDYLAESFMAGDPLNGGGFAILNGLEYDPVEGFRPRPRPYPGSNLFSLASGGAIYIRDPHNATVDEQLNGGAFMPLADADWKLIKPYLEENERLFGITIDELLTVDGKKLKPAEVYRKVGAVKIAALAASKSTDDSGA